MLMTTNTPGDTPDLSHGLAAIGAHLGLTAQQTEHRAARGELPTFKMGATICATRSGLADHFRKLQEAAHGERR